MFIRTRNNLVLRFDNGQFSFRHFATNATNEQLHTLAQGLNQFQEDPVRRILRVEEFELAV